MNLRTRLILLATLAFPLLALASLPPDVEKLIQQDKYTEALARVDALLKEKPDDAELKKLRADLAAQVPATGAAGSAIPDAQVNRFNDLIAAGNQAEAAKVADALAAFYPDDPRLPGIKAKLSAPAASAANPAEPVTPTTSAQPTGMERVAYNATLLLLQQAQQATDAATRKSLLQRFLNESEPLTRKYPGMLQLWQYRAAVALDLEEARAGAFAAANLLKLGAADSPDSALQQILAQLQLKGWLDPQRAEAYLAQDRATAEATQKLARERVAAEAEARALEAEWDSSVNLTNPVAWLRRAARQIPSIEKGFTRTNLLWRIANGFAEAGKLDLAKSVVAGLPEDEYSQNQDQLLCKYAEWQADHGQMEAAVQTVSPVKAGMTKNGACTHICQAQIKQGDLAGAEKTSSLLVPTQYNLNPNSYYLSVLADHFLKKGDHAAARQTVERIHDDKFKLFAYTRLARLCVKAGNQQNGLEYFDLARRACSQLPAGDKVFYLSSLARDEAQAGLPKVALADLAQARSLPKRIEEKDTMAGVSFTSIAEGYVWLNDLESVQQVLAEQQAFLRKTKDSFPLHRKALTMSSLAQTFKKRGDEPNARKYLAAINALAVETSNDPTRRAPRSGADPTEVYERHGEIASLWSAWFDAQHQQQDYQGAIATLPKIEVDSKGWACNRLATSWAREGDVQVLKKWVESLTAGEMAAQACLGAASGQIMRQAKIDE